MLSQPMSSPPGPAGVSPGSVPASASASRAGTTTSSQPSRPSRLRALSYLRNYTQNHLSRDSSSAHNSPTSPSGSSRPTSNLTRSVSYQSAAQTGAQRLQDEEANRLSLVDSAPTGHTARRAVPSEQSSLADVNSSATHSTGAASASIDNNGVAIMQRARATSASEAGLSANANSANGGNSEALPSIRFSAYSDPRSNRPSLIFPPITRTLPTGTESIRVGRYSERDGQAMANATPNQPSSAPVGFKSKVVSRRHCEFWHEDGKWYIKDVKSSSGTFLNHIRLSPPSQESKAYVVNDGDIVQLGIDFKGGEEMIFRCVKMRLELNRGWQTKLNTFNLAAHKRLRNMAGGPAAPGSNTDCSICLNSIAPCQSLFVAPCSHTWHFKCIKSILLSSNYPVFICPNCRAGADLEADVDEPTDWDPAGESEDASDDAKEAGPSGGAFDGTADGSPSADRSDHSNDNDATMAITERMGNVHMQSSPDATVVSPPQNPTPPMPINTTVGSAIGPTGTLMPQRGSRTPSPPGNGNEGPITPRNDAGPWVFDGSAGPRASEANGEVMASLNAAAELSAGTEATRIVSPSTPSG